MNKSLKNALMYGFIATLLAGCGDGTNPSGGKTTDGGSYEPPAVYEEIDTNTSAELWIMTWSGDGQDHLDIGHKPLPSSEVNALNVGMLQGVAKEFNKLYPNIKINIHTEVDDPSSGGSNWTQKILNFQASHGKYPDIWASFNIIDDMNQGLPVDLSILSNDPDYQKINPNLLSLTNYYGFQAALPEYAIPWGIYVNRALAKENNITAPATDWTWDDYTDFVAAAKPFCEIGQFCGAYDAEIMIPRGAFIEKQLQDTPLGSKYHVNVATKEFESILDSLPIQSGASALGVLSGSDEDYATAYMAAGGYWSYNYFKDNMLLTLAEEPWMLFESNVEGATNQVHSNDWDIYPRPAFLDEEGEVIVDNHVGVVLDPLGIYNYAQDDGNPSMSKTEYEKLKVAWTFTKFWLIDNRGWDAKQNSYYQAINPATSQRYEAPAVNDSFPIVKQGEEFNHQMDVWFSSLNHEAYADTTKFPGFKFVQDLWAAGNIYGISDKAFPRYYHLPGDSTDYSILEKIDGFGSESLIGVTIDDPAWKSTYTALLRQIDNEINGHYDQAFEELKNTMKTRYGWKDSDFPS